MNYKFKMQVLMSVQLYNTYKDFVIGILPYTNLADYVAKVT